MRAHAVALLMIVLIPTQCGVPAGKDVGGDNNPATGDCSITYEETVGGEHHRYPYLINAEQRLMAGKVLFTCTRPPTSHRATAWLETRRTGAGQQWRSVYDDSMARIPNPKDSIFLRGHCDRGTVAYWRIKVKLTGSGTDPQGRATNFEVEDFSREVRVDCP